MKVVLKAGGIRTTLLAAEETKKIVGQFAKQIAVVGSIPFAIDLSCRSWGKEAIDILVEFVKNNNVSQHVVFLNLADCIASRPTEEGLEVMEQLATALADSPKLIEIDLSDNAMGPRGLKPVKALLDNHIIARLYLSNCGFSFESMEFLRDSIQLNGGQMAKSLTELILDRNMIGVEGAKVVGDFLKDCKNLQLLSYAGCRPGPEGTKAICEGLAAGGSELRHIDLDDCTLGQGEDDDDAVLPLSRALKKSPKLTFLSMRDGDLGVTGVGLVVDALMESKAKLIHLVLESNGELGSDGSQLINRLVYAMGNSLRCLNLDSNELGDEGVCIVLEPFAAARNCLEELSLNMNEIATKGAEALVQANLPRLRILNLEDNESLPKKALKQVYGDRVKFGEDEDEDEDGGEGDEMEELVAQLNAAAI